MEKKYEIQCLDKGFIRLLDWMPRQDITCDQAVVQAARVSYDLGLKGDEKDRKLLRYLYKHQHMTPFEMVEFKFHVKMPIFVARQWVRHRTASINEVSARYTKLSDDFYVPTQWRVQDDKNKQGSLDWIESNEPIFEPSFHYGYIGFCDKAIEEYRKLLNIGIAREMARMVLPVSVYTEWYWKCDLRNILHFLKLRLDSHAQYEIRVYAEAMLKLIEPLCPWAIEVFKESINGST